MPLELLDLLSFLALTLVGLVCQFSIAFAARILGMHVRRPGAKVLEYMLENDLVKRLVLNDNDLGACATTIVMLS